MVVRRVRDHEITVIVDKELVLLTLSVRDSFPQLPVSLAIELVCLDEDAAARLSRLEEDEVAGDALALDHFDDLADLNVCGLDRHDGAGSALLSLEYGVLRVVHLFVAPVPLDIVITLLAHRHYQYEGQGRHVSEEETDFEEGNELTDGDDQEEQVEEELELVDQHLWNESQEVVLLIVQPVRHKRRRHSCPFHIQFALF